MPTRADIDTVRDPWFAAFLPAVVLLGIVLPLTCLPVIERLLFYLRPVELLPTYGTAYLLLALCVLPCSLVTALALRTLQSLGRFGGLYSGAVVLLIGISALMVFETLTSDVMTWVRTFGWLKGTHMGVSLTVLDVGLAAGVAGTRRGRATVATLGRLAAGISAVGALTLLSLLYAGARAAPTRLAATEAAPPPSGRPSILLVTVDALSAERMSLYGARRPTTPQLEDFARSATVFDRAYANANFTTPGIASILTGTRPWTHRATQLPSKPTVATRRDSLPALLQHAGYWTAYVASNPYAGAATQGFAPFFNAGASDRMLPLYLCFDRLAQVLPYECAAAQVLLFVFAQHFVQDVIAILSRGSNGYYDLRLAIGSAIALLNSAPRDRPLFLWVHLMPPHDPYAAPPPFLGFFDPSAAARGMSDSMPLELFALAGSSPQAVHTLEARYDESVRYVDYYLGGFLHEAPRLMGPGTTVIVSADHGESFTHGYGSHTGPELYDSIIHVPLLIKLPSQTSALRSSVLVQQVDIPATIAELAGITPPAGWEGHSLLALCRAQGDPLLAERPVYSMNFEQNPRSSPLTTGSVAVIEGPWKLVHHMGALHYELMPPLTDELYDLASDPGELTNLAEAQPQETRALRALIESELARHRTPAH